MTRLEQLPTVRTAAIWLLLVIAGVSIGVVLHMQRVPIVIELQRFERIELLPRDGAAGMFLPKTSWRVRGSVENPHSGTAEFRSWHLYEAVLNAAYIDMDGHRWTFVPAHVRDAIPLTTELVQPGMKSDFVLLLYADFTSSSGVAHPVRVACDEAGEFNRFDGELPVVQFRMKSDVVVEW